MVRKQTTIRMPAELNQKLDSLSDKLGFTRSDLIKSSVLTYLVSKELTDFEPVTVGSGDFVRTGIYFNDNLKELLEKQAESNNTSINSLIIYSAEKTYEYYSKLLEELGF